MAAKRKRRTNSKNTSAKQTAASNNAKRQIISVVLFAAAIFMFFVVVIKGENLWLALHNFTFGMLGLTAFVYPFLLGFIAVLFALDKFNGSVSARVIEAIIMVVLIGAAIDIFVPQTAENFFKYLGEAYSAGKILHNGGFLGALIGHPIALAFGATGAKITVILLIFVLLMIITGTSLIRLFRGAAMPVKKIKAHAENTYAKRLEEEEARKKAEIDISVDDIPEKRSLNTESLNDKQKKVLETYNGIAPDGDIADIYPDEQEEPQIMIDEDFEEAVTEAEEIAEKEKQDLKTEQEIIEEIDKAQKNSAIFLTESSGYKFPPMSLLKVPTFENAAATGADLDSTAAHLVDTLRSFGVETRIVDISRGPTVTRYELQPCAGVKISKITNLADDIALNLATAGVRIEAPIPNKAAVGIEVPNKGASIVGVREIIDSPIFTNSKSKLTIALGRDIGGNAVVTDIAKMPHGLIAGATGSGKSVCINSIIMSILYKATPEEVKLLMIDPKVVELGVYNGIPHLLVPVVTEPRKAAGALGWAVGEMEKRYRLFAENAVRDLAGYNRLAETNPELTKMPQIVIIIDELADLMMTSPREVEDSINRIAAKARAAGMHLLIATQRPSVDVVTGVIKANIPSRIAFAVSSQVDSRTILDAAGAEKLLGRGDMLFNPVGASKPNRIQGCFVSDEEVEKVVEFIKNDHSSDYDENIMSEIERQAALDNKQKIADDTEETDEDPMLKAAIETVVEIGQASTSLLQRKLKLGYARAARIIDTMEEKGIVGPYEGSKPRAVLLTKEMLLEKQAREE